MEHFFTGLLVVVALLVVWFAGYVVYRLYSDQR
ncbi:putative iron-regulated membrane protein [Saccharothrix algeriensis]|uniref:Iron-regulated membrane protein n=1 Tax=Saccharothrix algeriensis TaxID=173560 RepID=A0ABS2S9Y7_9PSEU|nr:putative iron-regulated membrane protein [Saccharothrix algeriensis]